MRSTIVLALALGVAAGAHRAGAQDSQTISPEMAWRLRVAAFKSLQAGSTVRVSARDIGYKIGKVLTAGDSALTLDGPGRIPYAGIDSVWIRRNHATTGFIVGSLVGAVVGLAVLSGRTCGDLSQTTQCIGTRALESLGFSLGGGLVGAIVGSASPSWKPRYP
jgi:hypothetical protein